ncbi:hypothetical protein BJY00DRAFT_305976 [Aspergillus carlsbadensis]|nr:hypothetical protein BJY00DRAFT_305976 [Aspergillus carlsbadensis]
MSQLREAPPLLQKALLLAGSLVRRVDTVEDLHLPYALYQQSKEAIYSSGGGDSITLLIAITIAACWSLRPPSVISLDGPWHWAGIAMRLALQLGLHQERTYPCLQDPNECRLVWWHLVNSDVLQAACWGRPCLIQTRHQDVQLPVHSDQDSIQLQVFNQVTRLLLILRRVIEHNMSQLSDIVPALVDWHQSVPEPLKLQNANGCRNTYSRPVNEMFILYFGFLMLVLFQHDTTKSHHTTTPTTTTSVSPITIAASSCMIRLYEEIHLHEDSPRLGSFHGFFLMLAAIPQIFHRTQVPEKERLREQELELICMVLGALHVKYGGSNMVLQKISKLRAESTDLQESEQAAAVAPGSHLVILESLVADSNILFPVPANFSPNLDLLDGYMPGDESQRDSAMDFLAFENSLIDWSATGSLYAPDFSQSIVL